MTDETFDLESSEATQPAKRAKPKRKLIPYTPEFERCWKIWSRKKDKQAAMKAWIEYGVQDDAALQKIIYDDLCARRDSGWFDETPDKYITYFERYISKGKWDDDWRADLKKQYGPRPGDIPIGAGVEAPRPCSDVGASINRLLFAYVCTVYRQGHRLTDDAMQSLVREKVGVLQESESTALREIADAPHDETKSKRIEWMTVLGDLCLTRWDDTLGLNIGRVAMQQAQSNARMHRGAA